MDVYPDDGGYCTGGGNKNKSEPRTPTSFVIFGGTWGDSVENNINIEGPEVSEQMPNWEKANPYNLTQYESIKYPGTLYDSKGDVTAKLRQANLFESLSPDENILIIGYSGGADSALIYAANNPVAALVLLDPSASGNMNMEGSQSLSFDYAVELITDLANNGTRIVLVDDNGQFGNGSKFMSDNILFIEISPVIRPHHSFGNDGTNGNYELINQCWDFIMNGN